MELKEAHLEAYRLSRPAESSSRYKKLLQLLDNLLLYTRRHQSGCLPPINMSEDIGKDAFTDLMSHPTTSSTRRRPDHGSWDQHLINIPKTRGRGLKNLEGESFPNWKWRSTTPPSQPQRDAETMSPLDIIVGDDAFSAYCKFAEVISKLDAARLQEPLLVGPKEDAVEIKVISKIEVTELVVEIKNLQKEQLQKIANYQQRVDHARAIVNTIENKIEKKLRTVLVKNGEMPFSKEMDWENETEDGAEGKRYAFKHGLEKEIEAAQLKLKEFESEQEHWLQFEKVMMSQLYHGLTSYALNNRKSPVTSLFMEFRPFTEAISGIELIWGVEQAYQWIATKSNLCGIADVTRSKKTESDGSSSPIPSNRSSSSTQTSIGSPIWEKSNVKFCGALIHHRNRTPTSKQLTLLNLLVPPRARMKMSSSRVGSAESRLRREAHLTSCEASSSFKHLIAKTTSTSPPTLIPISHLSTNMATTVFPYLPADELKKAEEESTARELSWLLDSLQDTLVSLKSGLEDCYALLAPIEPGSTLVISSPRSESIKGHITRVGTRIVKGTLHLRLRTHAPLHLSISQTHPLILPHLSHLRTLLNQALDCVDITRWTGDRHSGPFISSQLRLLHSILLEALSLLKGPSLLTPANPSPTTLELPPITSIPPWNETVPDPETFSPPLPSTLSLHLQPTSSSLLLTIRVLESTAVPPSTFNKFALAIGAQRRLEHDEMDEVFTYGGEEVRVREKVRVESSADPTLLVLGAKLGGFGEGLSSWTGGPFSGLDAYHYPKDTFRARCRHVIFGSFLVAKLVVPDSAWSRFNDILPRRSDRSSLLGRLAQPHLALCLKLVQGHLRALAIIPRCSNSRFGDITDLDPKALIQIALYMSQEIEVYNSDIQLSAAVRDTVRCRTPGKFDSLGGSLPLLL
ncbi:hypothetical protein G7Y89_g90 [Cudoniella acicularis]|uniref:Uncharacterized protein n=1 Tax=Cudoniella acicularis TaxID=354080 RepID=A0A8H4W987_9HELO|nr:hypothetical protein G7Y89_g90 [Cudoniella acicularis]